jgi:hypothetical protein
MEGHGSLISVQPAPHSDAVDTGHPAKNKKNRGPGVSPEAAPFKPLQFSPGGSVGSQYPPGSAGQRRPSASAAQSDLARSSLRSKLFNGIVQMRLGAFQRICR